MKLGRGDNPEPDTWDGWQTRLRALSDRATVTVSELTSTLTEMSRIVQSFVDGDNEMGGDKMDGDKMGGEIEDRGKRK
jgi:hypothetical protein